jgi:hypothetical protein
MGESIFCRKVGRLIKKQLKLSNTTPGLWISLSLHRLIFKVFYCIFSCEITWCAHYFYGKFLARCSSMFILLFYVRSYLCSSMLSRFIFLYTVSSDVLFLDEHYVNKEISSVPSQTGFSIPLSSCRRLVAVSSSGWGWIISCAFVFIERSRNLANVDPARQVRRRVCSLREHLAVDLEDHHGHYERQVNSSDLRTRGTVVKLWKDAGRTLTIGLDRPLCRCYRASRPWTIVD